MEGAWGKLLISVGVDERVGPRQPTNIPPACCIREALDKLVEVQATYYGAGQDSRGACGGNKLPTGPGGMTTVALNSPMYGNGENCGICIKVRAPLLLLSEGQFEDVDCILCHK